MHIKEQFISALFILINKEIIRFNKMRFPKKLSKERLSVLSPEDRKIYEQEHGEKKPENPILSNEWSCDNSGSVDEDAIFSDIDAEYEKILENAYVDDGLKSIYSQCVSDVLGEDEFMQAAYMFEQEIDAMLADEKAANRKLYEAEGLDSGAWVRGLNLGWLGKLAAIGLTGLATGLAALITAGRDKLAIARLKRYMNRLVELIDQGRLKRQSFFSSLLPTKWKRWRGEQNIACFRSIQEMADRNMTLGTLSAAHKLGFLALGGMQSLASGASPQPGSGLDAFKENVLSQLNIIVPEAKDPKS